MHITSVFDYEKVKELLGTKFSKLLWTVENVTVKNSLPSHKDAKNPAPTESPKRSPNVLSADREPRPPSRLSNVCRSPRPRPRLPVRVVLFKATPCQGRAGGGGSSWGALVLALTGVAYLNSRTGRQRQRKQVFLFPVLHYVAASTVNWRSKLSRSSSTIST